MHRGGRGGGYKELDEEEIEETKRRRKEAEEVRSTCTIIGLKLLNIFWFTVFLFQYQDDGELYDEFGNLKKKFRAKTQQAEAGRVLAGAGRAGWEVEELGV